MLWAIGAWIAWALLRDWPHVALVALLTPLWLSGEWTEATDGWIGADKIVAEGLLLLAITSIIAVGVSCQVAMHSAYHNLNVARAKYYAQCRMADFWIDLKKAPNTELELLADIPGVTEVRSRIQFFATVDLPGVAGEPGNIRFD